MSKEKPDKRSVPSISDLEGQAKMERDAERVEEQTGEAGLKFEDAQKEVTDALESIQQSGYRKEDDEEVATIKHIGRQGASQRPIAKPKIRLMKREWEQLISPENGQPYMGWKSKEVKSIAVDADELSGGIIAITVNGIQYVNREKLTGPSWREAPDKDFIVDYTPAMRKKRTSILTVLKDNNTKMTVDLKMFIDTNVVAMLCWGGYTFVHQGWMYHQGIQGRDARVMSLQDKNAGATVGIGG